MASKKPSYEELKRKVESLEKRLSSVTRAMKKIRVREKKYSFIAENSSDIILMADDRARYTYISPSHELHLKRGDEILGEIIFDHIHPEDKDRTREIFFALFETREPARVEYRYNHPERGYIWLESTGQPFLTDDGSVQVVIISREVTKRRQAEDELKASEERFRAIFESSDDFIFLKDSELRYVMANPATQELFGLSSTEIMGKVDSELFGAEAAAHIENSDLRVLKGEILEEVDSKPVNGIFRTYHVKKTPVQGANGEIAGICGIARDITERHKAEKALVESENKYRTLFVNSPLGIFRSTPEGRFIEVNPALARMLGYDSPESVLEEIYSISEQIYVCSEEREPIVEERLASEDAGQYFNRYRRRDGTEFPANLYLKTIRDNSGNVLYLEGIVEDVTAQHEAEEALRKSRRHFRDTLESLNELVVQIDTDFVINLNNRASSEMLNIPRDEFSGRKCFSLFYDREDICPDCPAMEAMRSGKQVDVLRYRPDGHILARSVYPVFDDDGTISGATILASDVTEEKDAEKKLKDALEDSRLNARKLESMFRAAKIVLKMENFQEAARHIFDSAAELTGATSGYVALLSRDGEENELLFLESGGRPCSVNPDLPMPVRGFRAEAYLQNKVVYDNDFARSKWMRFMPRGHMRLDNVLFAPLVVEGKTLGIIGLANKDGGFTDEDARTAQAFGDLAAIALRNSKTIAMLVESERAANKAAEIADTANRAKSEFLANMSHEIRTPLNGILGMIQLMQTTALNGEQEEYVDMAHKSTKRLNRLLTDILDLSRIEAGKMEIREDPFDVREVLESIEDIFVHAARKNNNAIKVVMDENVPKRLLGDSTRLTEILFNLVGNACKYTNDGQIEVELVKVNDSRKDVNRLLFLVSDNGSGIPDEKISQVFETFTQANDSESPFTRQYEGAGLGLALVKRLVELMGGNVAIDSEPGKGTAVYVNLPFRICETDKSRAARRIESEHAVPPQGRILLVDDDSITRLHGQRLLEKVGYEVEIAENGMAALDKLAQGSYGCVLMDVQMPVMDGVEATKKIRASHAGYKDIPVIAMTAFAMVGDREKFLDAGMDDYISKPVNKDELLAVLEKNIS